ncbi:DGQHR domain-containing protein [Salmonella enterica]|nr:DGQHR domain-containing protein [Salmonella enterica]
MNADNYFFRVPATRGIQGGIEQYMLTVPMVVLRRILAMDNDGDVMDRSQREANKARAKKIRNYVAGAVTTRTPYILPSITGNIDSHVEFLPSELSPAVGILKIPMDADLKLFDGQHRALGIFEFVRDYSNTEDTISLLLTVGLPLELRQQFFADINNNASKPAAAISMAYNNNDPVNQLAMHLARTVTGLAGTVDFEHNVVPAKSSRLISFKALNDATKKMLNLRANSVPSPQQRDMAERLWTAWAQAMRWNDIAQDDIAAEYRQEALGLHGIMINAIGLATARMLQHRTAESIENLLTCAENGDNGFHYRESFVPECWEGKCVDPETGTIKTDRRALEATAEALHRLIDPFADVLWLRMYLPVEEASDPVLLKYATEIEKYKQQSEMPMVKIVERLKQLCEADPRYRASVLSSSGAFGGFLAEAEGRH